MCGSVSSNPYKVKIYICNNYERIIGIWKVLHCHYKLSIIISCLLGLSKSFNLRYSYIHISMSYINLFITDLKLNMIKC